MEDFSITVRLTEKEYSKIMYSGLYRKPGMVVTGIVGIFLILSTIVDPLKIIAPFPDMPYVEIVVGLLGLLLPTLIVLMALKQLRSNPGFQHEMVYTFSEEGFKIQGNTFKGEFQWAHIIKRKEINKFLILYHSKRMGNFIDKTKLADNQLQFIRSKVGRK